MACRAFRGKSSNSRRCVRNKCRSGSVSSYTSGHCTRPLRPRTVPQSVKGRYRYSYPAVVWEPDSASALERVPTRVRSR
jgi:hypothetical protein